MNRDGQKSDLVRQLTLSVTSCQLPVEIRNGQLVTSNGQHLSVNI